MDIINTTFRAEKEKVDAALSSVLAATGLTFFKILVGLMTNSLGILAEAAHSGLDFVAALVTLVAVRISDRPADPKHPYGHGKVENLSAFFETLLLLATCVWIIYESIRRLFFTDEAVEISFWAFLVMGISIVVDISRSRMLYRAAKKYNSRALEADALHFSTDIWSSAVVILGLIAVSLTKVFPHLEFLAKADALAALIVAGIVVFVSLELGMRSIQSLLDHAPQGTLEKIEAAARSVSGVKDFHGLRVRISGAGLFVDLHIQVDAQKTLSETHAISHQVVLAIQAVEPKSDITVHAEPVAILSKRTKRKIEYAETY